MDLITFLTQIQSPHFFDATSVVYCIARDYSYSLSMLIRSTLHMHQGYFFKTVDMEKEDWQSVIAQLEMSFLGMKGIYWLQNVELLSGKTASLLYNYLQNYSGQHKILLITTKKDQIRSAPHQTIVDVPETIEKNSCFAFSALMSLDSYASTRRIIDACYNKGTKLTLDRFFMLAQYIPLLGQHEEWFVDEWLFELIEHDTSLFNLSAFLFAKNAKKFFVEWKRLCPLYSDQFWLVFWSDQFWRAACFVDCMRKNSIIEAKKISARLPFSFMQRDWKKFSKDELIDAHNFLCRFDNHLKNGGNDVGFELFFLDCLNGRFPHTVNS